MLRQGLLAAARSEGMRGFVEQRSLTRKVVERFVAGDTLDDAADVARACNAMGASVALDHLGEAVRDEDGARRAGDAYLEMVDRIAADGLDASVSAKPTQLGLDVSVDLMRELVESLCLRAGAHDIHVALDMEGAATTDATVDVVGDLRAQGHRIGCAVQAYLHRTPTDLARLTELGASLRICKGAYAEPDADALQSREAIRDAFMGLVQTVLDTDVHGRFATHDDVLIERIIAMASERQRAPSSWELQMLYGVRPPLQRDVLARGHALRIYVPYGTQWYPYFMRRLAERPANVAFFCELSPGEVDLTSIWIDVAADSPGSNDGNTRLG